MNAQELVDKAAELLQQATLLIEKEIEAIEYDPDESEWDNDEYRWSEENRIRSNVSMDKLFAAIGELKDVDSWGLHEWLSSAC